MTPTHKIPGTACGLDTLGHRKLESYKRANSPDSGKAKPGKAKKIGRQVNLFKSGYPFYSWLAYIRNLDSERGKRVPLGCPLKQAEGPLLHFSKSDFHRMDSAIRTASPATAFCSSSSPGSFREGFGSGPGCVVNSWKTSGL